MAIDFPNTPTSGDSYTVGDKSWQWDGAKWIADGAFISPSILKVDQANSRVGIGTTTPTQTLDVNGIASASTFVVKSGTGTYAAGALGYTDSNWGLLYRPPQAGATAAHLFESFAGADLVAIKEDGKVGIGTTAPTYPLHVQSDTQPQLFIQAATNADAVIRSGSGPSWVNNFHQIRFNHYAVASGHGPDNKINFEVNGGTEATPTTRMTINGDGNVGIGTTTPNHSLSFGSPSNGTRSLALWENGTAFYGLGNDTNRLAFYASNAAGTAERMVLTSDGNVGIGTTAPVRRLTVESDLCVATGNTAYLWQTNTTNTNLQLWSKTASGDTGWGQRVYMTQSATSWAAGSDRRIKRDIVDHDGDLAEVLGLRVRSYNFNDDAADQPARYGFITDEVPASLGHLVTGEAGAVTIDEETGEEKPDPQGLFYTDLVPHLVGAIQELSAQNASLVVRIETLETA